MFKELSEGFCSAECKEAYDLNVKAAQASTESDLKLNFLTDACVFTPLPTHVIRAFKSKTLNHVENLFNQPVSHFCLQQLQLSINHILPKEQLTKLLKLEGDFYSGNFEVRASKLDGDGVFAAKDLKKGSFIGILFGRYCWMSSIVARRTECTEDQLKQGLRHRVMDISEEFNVMESFPLVGQLKKLIDKRNSEIVEEREKLRPYLIMHEWSALGRINSSRGAGLSVTVQQKSITEHKKPLDCYEVLNISSSSETSCVEHTDDHGNTHWTKTFHLPCSPNAVFLFTPSYSKVYCNELAHKFGLKIPPLVCFVVKASKDIKKGTEILVDYEYDNPLLKIDQRLVKCIESEIDALKSNSETGIETIASINSHFKKSVPEIKLEHKLFNEDEESSVESSDYDESDSSRKRKRDEI